jgi:hypothetical protein
LGTEVLRKKGCKHVNKNEKKKKERSTVLEEKKKIKVPFWGIKSMGSFKIYYQRVNKFSGLKQEKCIL